jgi:hypothetical protein
MSERPWRNPAESDLTGWDRTLPAVVRLAPDFGAGAPRVPLWGNGFGNISWQFTKLSPELLDRLSSWQQIFEESFTREGGWASERGRDEWATRAHALAAELRAELDGRSDVDVDLWPLDEWHP